jgi:hypothetical protein
MENSKYRPPTPSTAASHAPPQARNRQAVTRNASSHLQAHHAIVRRIKVLRLSQKRLERDLRRNSADSVAYAKLGDVLMELGDWSEAVKVLQQATHLGIYDAKLLSSLGQAMFEDDHDPSAVVHCLEAALEVLHMKTTPADTGGSIATNRKGTMTETTLDIDHFAYLVRAYALNGQPVDAIQALETHIFPPVTSAEALTTVANNRVYGASRGKLRPKSSKRPSSAADNGRKYDICGMHVPSNTMQSRSLRFGGIGAHYIFCASQVSPVGAKEIDCHYSICPQRVSGEVCALKYHPSVIVIKNV